MEIYIWYMNFISHSYKWSINIIVWFTYTIACWKLITLAYPYHSCCEWLHNVHEQIQMQEHLMNTRIFNLELVFVNS